MTQGETVVYQVQAYNTASASENKIHDDRVARDLGFGGGLVPGVDIYAYMTRAAVDRWGREWLARGMIRARFVSPVYHGETVKVVSEPVADGEGRALTVRNAQGVVCATGFSCLPDPTPLPPQAEEVPRAPLPEDPPPASPESLRKGTVFGTIDGVFHADFAKGYLADVRETLPIYEQLRVAHPGHLLQHANLSLVANVKLGPWIHAASEVQNFGVVGDGECISTRARVADAYEKSGHRFVEMEVVMLTNDDRPLARMRHVAIYEPRQLRDRKE